jgi:hypothetical protein
VLEVYRDPIQDPKHPFGHSYRTKEHIAADGQVTPLALPEKRLAVRQMLPP